MQLKIRVSDRLADLGRQPVDLALRYGEPKDSKLIALPLVPDNHRVLCASPDYIRRCGVPERPDDIGSHQVLQLVLGDAVHSKWQFWLDGQLQQVQVRGALVADDGDVVRRWAVAGLGIAYKSRLDILSDLGSGALVKLLPDYKTEQAPLYLLAVQRLSSSAVLKALFGVSAAQVAFALVRLKQKGLVRMAWLNNEVLEGEFAGWNLWRCRI